MAGVAHQPDVYPRSALTRRGLLFGVATTWAATACDERRAASAASTTPVELVRSTAPPTRGDGRPMEGMRVSFVAGPEGPWEIVDITAARGAGLAAAPRLARLEGSSFTTPTTASWSLDGVRSNERYTEQAEQHQLVAVQPDLGRREATLGTLIPMSKSAAWWKLAQDRRRAIFEARSAHIAIGLQFLPAIARRLYHCRDLGGEFDFLTWFEYAPVDAARFVELLRQLRATPEWEFVEREVEVHVRRDPRT